VLGSGWIWLARVQQNGGRLRVFTTTGNGNPMLQGHFPLLVNDIWEHALLREAREPARRNT
jgi:Fe-Mn family superoxide dismutase